MVPDPRLDDSYRKDADQVLSSLLDFNPREWGLPPFEDSESWGLTFDSCCCLLIYKLIILLECLMHNIISFLSATERFLVLTRLFSVLGIFFLPDYELRLSIFTNGNETILLMLQFLPFNLVNCQSLRDDHISKSTKLNLLYIYVLNKRNDHCFLLFYSIHILK